MAICKNPSCKAVTYGNLKNGWQLRKGNHAQLCDPCASAFAEGNFCETFHSDAAGWRSCESCRKRVHCGCIASIHLYIFLDIGGVQCVICAKKNFINSLNQLSPPSPSTPLLQPNVRDISLKSYNPTAGPSAVPGEWRPPFSLSDPSPVESELHPRIRYGIDGIKIISGESSVTALDMKKYENPSDGIIFSSPNLGAIRRFANGNTGIDMMTAFHGLPREDGNPGGLGASYTCPGDNDLFRTRKTKLAEPGYTPSSGTLCEAQTKSIVKKSLWPSSSKNDRPNLPFRKIVQYSSPNDSNGLDNISSDQSEHQTANHPFTKQSNSSIHNGRDISGETQACNGRLPVDGLPRYWPRSTDQELQHISGDSNSVITPLFEKMLSASDAGRIGRLILPKRCAEAYFPKISNSEGVPLKVQDIKGQEWVFQFRFWPNNNSRMYVLEGVTPCIQSMQLQAGDIVTFSRQDPEGKLVMGFRKASNVRQSDQDNQAPRTSNGVPKNAKVNPPDATSKRKQCILGSKSKCPKIENEVLIDLKLEWAEAQGLLRPQPNHFPSVVVIDGLEIEEYEEPPIIGKPTFFTTACEGEKVQWAQCEDCSKWRKLPSSVILPSGWTCSANSWDLKRSSCSSAQEITTEQLEDLLSSDVTANTSKKTEVAEKESPEGLDALANLAILGEGDVMSPSAQPTTRHPRHRPGCTCIVCIQPPSGKGPRHKDTCICNVCSTVRRRFHTLMLRREKRQSEKEAESARKKLEMLQLPENSEQGDNVSQTSDADDIDLPVTTGESNAHQNMLVYESSDDPDPNERKSSIRPCKAGIDLNIQPEREDEPSPK